MSTATARAATPPTPPADPNADWTAAETAFFEKHGVKDEKEKEIIRGRARVIAYDRERQKFEEKHATPNPEPTPAPDKKWYE